MVNLVFEGRCKDCGVADIALECLERANGEHIWIAACNHEEACLRMANRIAELINKSDATEETLA